MILILSNENDQSTNKVIDWLTYYDADYIRVNYKSVKKLDTLRISNSGVTASFIVDDQVIEMDSISSFWYRRGDLQLTNDIHRSSVKTSYLEFLTHDLRDLEQFFYYLIEQKEIPKLCSFQKARVNKLQILAIAAKHGLRIPDTLVSSKSNNIKSAIQRNKLTITKAISNTIILEEANQNLMGYTVTIKEDEVKQELLHPELIQEGVEKKYEIRVFYLDGECYAMAIFSQTKEETKTDFRLYDDEDPIRQTPVELPDEVTKKIRLLMEEIDLKIGAIDLLYTKQEEYFFLEVNPVGQYDWMENSCNYFLHRAIAKYLISNEKN